ncbi:NusB antitermination factor [Thalassoporum mexicanum PCC 7367]|uniref:transcription antitermination factor NusB n=1 Tax=Thalassoporum mexicanum TaxID=3457544 RepID=UPI00029FDDEA|nr:transcription antitermination factor NusB [Pseudanabaena sp. PCC 7367]AFY71274.1 NusB antitermination factor [Pseudanabaena sp. PCC 7367]
MQARHVSRELALLSMGQLPTQPEKLQNKTVDDMLIATVRSLVDEVREMLLTAGAEVQRGNDKLVESEDQLVNSKIRTADINTSQVMLKAAIDLTGTAINRVGQALEFPLMVQFARQPEVKEYAIEILTTVNANRAKIDETIAAALEGWQLNRLPKIDQKILRIAVAELMYLETPTQIAINEAIELAKRYSGEDGYRFINGVLRTISNRLKAAK